MLESKMTFFLYSARGKNWVFFLYIYLLIFCNHISLTTHEFKPIITSSFMALDWMSTVMLNSSQRTNHTFIELFNQVYKSCSPAIFWLLLTIRWCWYNLNSVIDSPLCFFNHFHLGVGLSCEIMRLSWFCLI